MRVQRFLSSARIALLLAVVVLGATLGALPARGAAPEPHAPLGQSLVMYLPPAYDGDIPLYGANERIEVISGSAVVGSCVLGGTNDPGPVPVSNTDIVAVGPGGEHRTSITTLGGLNLGTSIGFTGPTGEFPTGTYDVYFDECQDGEYSPLVDPLFPQAFRVVVPADAQIIDLGAVKAAAAEDAAAIAAVSGLYEFAGAVGDPVGGLADFAGPEAGALYGLATGDVLPDPVELVLDRMQLNSDLIAKDPPDPAFTQATVVPPGAPALAPRDDAGPGELAAIDSLDLAGGLASALLHALERYQGAAQVGAGPRAGDRGDRGPARRCRRPRAGSPR
jgi:hypothetical protein